MTLEPVNALYEAVRREMVEIYAEVCRIGGWYRFTDCPPEIDRRDTSGRAWGGVEIELEPPRRPGERRVEWTLMVETRLVVADLSMTATIYRATSGERVAIAFERTQAVPLDDPDNIATAFTRDAGAAHQSCDRPGRTHVMSAVYVWQVARRVMREAMPEIERIAGRWTLTEYPVAFDSEDHVWGSALIEGYRRRPDGARSAWWSLHVAIHQRPDRESVEVEVDIWREPWRAPGRSVGKEAINVPPDDPDQVTAPFVRRWVDAFIAFVAADEP